MITLDSIRLNPTSIPPFICSVLFALLGLYVYFQGRGKTENRLFAIWCALTSYWQAAWTILFNTENEEMASRIIKMGYSGIVFLPVFLFHFLAVLLSKEDMERPWIRAGYGLTLGFLLSIWTDGFIGGYYEYSWGYYPKAGLPFHPLFLIFVTAYYLRCHRVLSHSASEALRSEREKNQLKYLTIAVFIYFLAASDFLVNYGFKFYPAGIIPITVSLCLIAYSIAKYRLLDISVLARRAGLLVLIYSVLLIFIVPVVYVLYRQLLTHNPFASFLIACLIVGTGLSIGPVLYAYMIRTRSYFQEGAMAGLTHELKSPLAAIESALEFLEEAKKSPQSGSLEAGYFQMLEKNVTRLRLYVDELLQVFTGDEASNSLSIEKADLNLICQRVVDSYKSSLILGKIEFRFENSGFPALVDADVRKIEKVLSNLLSNSFKFTKEGMVIVRFDRQKSGYRVCVEDSGIGIPGDELPLVFNRFFQGKFGQKLKGSGIGLTVAKAWVEAHGGEIWAESDGVGKGARLIFTLPFGG